jgi:hypothetical protein
MAAASASRAEVGCGGECDLERDTDTDAARTQDVAIPRAREQRAFGVLVRLNMRKSRCQPFVGA